MDPMGIRNGGYSSQRNVSLPEGKTIILLNPERPLFGEILHPEVVSSKIKSTIQRQCSIKTSYTPPK